MGHRNLLRKFKFMRTIELLLRISHRDALQ